MRTLIPLTTLAVAFAGSLFAAPAQAQRARVFVASYGNDGNPCTFLSPCRTFQQAVNVVDASGEVTAIDSAGFGLINITKAVTITSPPGVEAGIVPAAAGDNAITINAGPNDAIVLNGLTLNAYGNGGAGVNFLTGSSLTVTNCVVQNFEEGILFSPNVASDLFVSNTLLTGNWTGIYVAAVASAITAVLNHVEANNNSAGFEFVETTISASSTITATVSESVASHNSGAGVIISNSIVFPAAIKVTLFHSVIADNGIGLNVLAGTSAPDTITITQSAVTGNAAGWNIAGTGAIQTYQDNNFNDNGPNTGSLTNITKQ
jgi:hypothetical protein